MACLLLVSIEARATQGLPGEHEEQNRLIDRCIAIIALEWKIEYCDAGCTTFKREDLERGFEPDSCFYVQRAGQIAGKKRLAPTQ